jgi:sigma-B regulation protein RsbU (phosphoserine phosphatase)
MISAVDEMSSVIRCIELGAEDYLPKPFDPTLLRARVGASLEKKGLRDEIARHVRRMERELETARTIQLSMVPTDFPKASADRPVVVHARLRPALEIGGDLYDCFWLDDDYLCLVVADVSDKGASAGLYMARTKTVIRLMAKTLGRNAGAASSVAELLGEVNNELCRDNPHAMFATICICVLNARTGAVVCCNAGHDAPYLVGADGSTTRLFAAGSLPAGIEPDQIYAAEAREIPPGSTLFVYTDGITEAMNEHRELFGVTRLEEALRGCAGQAPDILVNATLEKVQAFAGAAPPSDDIAALACRWG